MRLTRITLKRGAKGYQVLFRRGSAYAWEQANPILAEGEPGLDTTQHILKIGDGHTPWRQLRPATVNDIVLAQLNTI